MINDIIQTNRLASAAGMSYGEYVAQHGIASKDRPPKAKTLRCKDCNTDISHIKHGAKYCTFCTAKRLGSKE